MRSFGIRYQKDSLQSELICCFNQTYNVICLKRRIKLKHKRNRKLNLVLVVIFCLKETENIFPPKTNLQFQYFSGKRHSYLILCICYSCPRCSCSSTRAVHLTVWCLVFGNAGHCVPSSNRDLLPVAQNGTV